MIRAMVGKAPVERTRCDICDTFPAWKVGKQMLCDMHKKEQREAEKRAEA